MSLPEIAVEVANGTAVTLATGAVTGGAVWISTKVRNLLHRGTPAEQDAVIAVFDDLSATPEELTARLTPLLQAHLDAYPEAINEFKALTVTGSTVYNQHNTGSGLFIGGDNHGGLTINHGAPARG